jgi:hypothetical protein
MTPPRAGPRVASGVPQLFDLSMLPPTEVVERSKHIAVRWSQLRDMAPCGL